MGEQGCEDGAPCPIIPLEKFLSRRFDSDFGGLRNMAIAYWRTVKPDLRLTAEYFVPMPPAEVIRFIVKMHDSEYGSARRWLNGEERAIATKRPVRLKLVESEPGTGHPCTPSK